MVFKTGINLHIEVEGLGLGITILVSTLSFNTMFIMVWNSQN
jgi:hypothetical protein